ncbi:MAG TPA: hypothetical protein VNP92_22515 [Actinophytocola sp.]|nr:hypothetical protein [Actinophytocola sp.]
MDTLSMRELIRIPGPFASVYLPSPGSWRVLRRRLAGQVDRAVLDTLDRAVARRKGRTGRVLVTAAGTVLADETPSWSAEPFARFSDLPYVLPLVRHYSAAAPNDPPNDSSDLERSTYDQFLFEVARPGGLAVDGLQPCTQSLREDNADALVISVERLGDATVWVAGGQWHLVSTDTALRGMGLPIFSRRADEVLPMAALANGARVMVTTEPLPLADGVGVLLRMR